MERNSIKEIIFNIIKLFKEEPIREFNDELGLDSLDFIDFVVYIEKEFNIIVTDDKMKDIRNLSLKDIIDYIYKEINNNGN